MTHKEAPKRPVRKTPKQAPPPLPRTAEKRWQLERVNDFLDRNPSLWRVAWALLWRFLTLILALQAALAVLRGLISYLLTP